MKRTCKFCNKSVTVLKNKSLRAHMNDGVRCLGAGSGRSDYMHHADELFSLYVRARDGHCLARGYRFACNGPLQCAHIIERWYKTIRVDSGNAVALCAAHHRYVDTHPIEKELFFEDKFPGLQDRLKALALSYMDVDWKHEVERLKTLLAEQERWGT